MNRRELLAAGSAVAATSLAGCTSGVLAAESDLEWSGDYYASEGGLSTDAALYFLGEVTNTGGNHIQSVEMTITLVDENDQEITSRSKTLSKIRVGTTQEVHFRIGLSDGEVGDLDDVEISADITGTSYAPLANPDSEGDET